MIRDHESKRAIGLDDVDSLCFDAIERRLLVRRRAGYDDGGQRADEDRDCDDGPLLTISHEQKIAYARRRPIMSKPTAATRTAPLLMYCVAFSTERSDIPLSRLAMMSAPSIAPETVPRPPMRLVPPITHAAIASSSMSVPASGDALPTRAVCRIAATPTSPPRSE